MATRTDGTPGTFVWTPHPEAAQFVAGLVEDFLGVCPPAAELAGRAPRELRGPHDSQVEVGPLIEDRSAGGQGGLGCVQKLVLLGPVVPEGVRVGKEPR